MNRDHLNNSRSDQYLSGGQTCGTNNAGEIDSAQKGLTLIELMIAMIIVGMMSTLAVPAYNDYLVVMKYRHAVPHIVANRTAVINYAIKHERSFAALSDAELSAAQMKAIFNIENTTRHKYMKDIGGIKASDWDFLVYQYIDKDEIGAPEIAPEMLAMAVVLTDVGGFLFDCHYYHSSYQWDYPGGERYGVEECAGSTARLTNLVNATQGVEADTSTGPNDHGHGNNEDGVDSSNPGRGHHKQDASCPIRNGSDCVDDEKQKGNKK